MGRRRATRYGRDIGNGERRGNSRKGPNGKAVSLGKWIMKAIPCARQLAGKWHCSPGKARDPGVAVAYELRYFAARACS